MCACVWVAVYVSALVGECVKQRNSKPIKAGHNSINFDNRSQAKETEKRKVYANTDTHIYTHTDIHIYIYIYIYTHTHTYIYNIYKPLIVLLTK